MIETRALVEAVTDAWLADPEAAIEWAGDHEGRRGVRMAQTVRDKTTVWFDCGERTVTVEAYVLPPPERDPGEAFRQALVRNHSTRRMRFAVDRHGSLVLIGKIPNETLTEEELELALGEVYDLIEVSFPGLVRAAFGREKKAPE